MNPLLALAIEAHGGWERWNKFRSLRASLSVTGALFASKGMADFLTGIQLELQLHEQKVITELPSQGKRFHFEPELVVVESKEE